LILWRIDGEGRIIWKTQLVNLTNPNDPLNQTVWQRVADDDHFNVKAIARGRNGAFVIAGEYYPSTMHNSPGLWDPCIIKIRDLSLIGIECTEPCIFITILLIPLYVAWQRIWRTKISA
jgi:hypothetical protein